MGEEADADWQAGLVEWGYENGRDRRPERSAKTKCPTCGKSFKCMEAHHLVKHGSFPVQKGRP